MNSLLNEFIEKAKKIHNNKYTYEKFTYSGKAKKGIITCPQHGYYLQSPSDHLQGHGCLKCYHERRSVNKEKYLEMIKDIHPNLDYTNLDYKGYTVPTEFKCKLHGTFIKKPEYVYKTKEPCPTCYKLSIGRKLAKPEKVFLEQAKALYGEEYDYSKVVYENSYTKVKILCKKHGYFYKTPNDHISGSGCPVCSKNKSSKTQEVFINQLKSYRGDEFIYDKTHYINATTKVIVTCPKHGDKEATPVHLLLRTAPFKCPDCLLERKHDQFIKRAKELHGNKYDYSKAKFVKNLERLEIICPIHGSFWQTPNNHLGGHGCRLCGNSSVGEVKIDKFLKNNSIRYIHEYTLPGYRYRYDFYLPDFNILIEYHGEQHYEDRFYINFAKEESLENRKIKDKFKVVLAKEKNIPLIIINYQDKGNLIYVLKRAINNVYKYKYNGKYFRNIRELFNYIAEETGNTNITKEDVEQYKIDKIID